MSPKYFTISLGTEMFHVDKHDYERFLSMVGTLEYANLMNAVYMYRGIWNLMKLASIIMKTMPETGETMVDILSRAYPESLCSDDETLRNANNLAAFKD